MSLSPLQPGLPAFSASTTAAATTSKGAVPNDATKIADSARQFESMLVRQVLADTFKPTSATGGAPAPGAEIYQGFVTDIIADHISQGSSLGISNLLQSQLQPSVRPHTTLNVNATAK